MSTRKHTPLLVMAVALALFTFPALAQDAGYAWVLQHLEQGDDCGGNWDYCYNGPVTVEFQVQNPCEWTDGNGKNNAPVLDDDGNPIHEVIEFEGDMHYNVKIKDLGDGTYRWNYHANHGGVEGIGSQSGGQFHSNGVINQTYTADGNQQNVVFICHYVNHGQPKVSQNFMLHMNFQKVRNPDTGKWELTNFHKWAHCVGNGGGNQQICSPGTTSPQCLELCDEDPSLSWC